MLKWKQALRGKQTGDASWSDNVENVQMLSSTCFSLVVL